MAPDWSDFTPGDERALYQWHVAFDTSERRNVRFPDFSCPGRSDSHRRPAGWETVKRIPALSTGHVTTQTDLIAVLKFLDWVGGFFVSEGSENIPFAKMTAGAGDPFVLQPGVEIRIRRQNGIPFAPVPKTADQALLSTLQGGVAVFANLLGSVESPVDLKIGRA